MLICLTMVIYFFLFLYISSDFCFVVIQLLNCVWLFATPWTTACQDSLSFNIFWSLLKLMSIESLMLSNHLICCRLLLLLLSIFPTIRVFPIESALCIRWPKYWSFCFSISPSNEYSGLIFFRIDWLDLLAVQRTLKSLLQHHSSKASLLALCVWRGYSKGIKDPLWRLVVDTWKVTDAFWTLDSSSVSGNNKTYNQVLERTKYSN